LKKIACRELTEMREYSGYYRFDLDLVVLNKFSVKDAACVCMLEQFTEHNIECVDVELCENVIKYYAANRDGDFEKCAWELWRKVENHRRGKVVNYVEIHKFAWFDEKWTEEFVVGALVTIESAFKYLDSDAIKFAFRYLDSKE